jgi:hypothetical protein
MVMNRLQSAWDAFKNPQTYTQNKLYEAVFRLLGGQTNTYNQDISVLLIKGYGENPDVNAMINQMALKSTVVPFYVKKIKDEKKLQLVKSYPIELTPQQKKQLDKIKAETYSDEYLRMPLDRPNALQTWNDLIFLYKLYLKVCGNVYFYKMSPSEGINKGVPLQLHILPSHWVKIVLKPNASMVGTESPIDYYVMEQGNQFIRFEADSIIHIKRTNPFFDYNGTQLYGYSELMAAIRNINSSNSFIDTNVKTSQNSGVYGFIHAGDGQSPLTPEQAQLLKDRLVDMDNSDGKLSNIAGSSAKLGFTRISLTTDELKPFEFLSNDRRTLANCLNWDVNLLNEDRRTTGGGGFTDTLIEARKRVMIDNIKPDLDLLASYLNPEFIRKFKGYENAELEFDITEMPEMQTDMETMSKWVNSVPLTLNERREVFNYERMDDEMMDEVYIPNNLVNLNDPSVTDLQNGQA